MYSASGGSTRALSKITDQQFLVRQRCSVQIHLQQHLKTIASTMGALVIFDDIGAACILATFQPWDLTRTGTLIHVRDISV